MTDAPKPRLSVSTWSLHRVLGLTYPDSPGNAPANALIAAQETYGPGSISLLEVPSRVADFGIHTLEICHFQLPSREQSYLNELRGALQAADVELFSLLIDDGDMTHPEHGARDVEWIGGWIDTAAQLGATCARVIAGKSEPDAQALERSRQGFEQLVKRANEKGVRVTTENWFATLSRPPHVADLLGSLNGQVGLCVDFGNWGGATKYEDLAAIMPRGESCHTKCSFPAPRQMDLDDYRRCLDLSRAAGFSGPYTLIYDGSGDDEWEALALERDVVAEYLA